MIDPFQRPPHADRPGDRRTLDAERRLDLVEQIDRLAAVAIELVDEGHDRRVAQAADVHQLDRPGLHTLGAIDDHESRIDGGQRSIGVFGEVLVPRRVEQVHDAVAIGKLHHRRGHRDAALLLERHPVGRRVAAGLAALYRARHVDGAAEQQELLGQRRLPGVRVRNDGKRTPLADFTGYR